MYPIMRAMTMIKYQQKHIMHQIKHNIQAITIPKYPGVALAFFLAGVSASHDCSAKTTAVLSRVSVMIQVNFTRVHRVAGIRYLLRGAWGSASMGIIGNQIPT